MTDNLKRRILYPLFFILLGGILVFNIYRFISPSHAVKVKTYQVSDGWGYQVIKKGKVIIDQPFIPVIRGTKAFPDRKSASRAGKIVRKRIVKKQHPALTVEDILKIGLDSSGNLK
jgi:hypothetical protein